MIRLLRSRIPQPRFSQRTIHSTTNIVARSAKSASRWTQQDLKSYNISIRFQDTATFFKTPALPEPTVNQEILTTVTADHAVTEDTYRLLTHLDLAMLSAGSKESEVDYFAVELFHALGYIRFPRAICTQRDIRIFICREYRSAILNVCIIDRRSRDDIVLLVQEDEGFGSDCDPFPQLVAKVIAAFQSNNGRQMAFGLGRSKNKIIPGVIIFGTSPTFVKVLITTELVQCVQHGEYPATPTVVLAHVPDIPRPFRRRIEGMKPLDNRHLILQCYESFKKFVD